MAETSSPPKIEPKRDNPYLHARTEWLERYGDYVASARNWRLLALGAMGVAVLLAADNWHLANKAQSVPYIVREDHLGQLLYVGQATQLSAESPLIIRSALSTWVRNARSVLSDPIAERVNVDQVYAFIAKGSSAYSTLTEWFGNRQPFVMAQTQEVSVQIESAIPVGSSPRTWQVLWTETTTTNDGQHNAPERWIATITFDQVVPTADSRAAIVNPIGLEITHFNWAKQG